MPTVKLNHELNKVSIHFNVSDNLFGSVITSTVNVTQLVAYDEARSHNLLILITIFLLQVQWT